jgi:hypothetical protein
MKYTLQTLALASAASARVLHTRQSSCCFGINVSGDGVDGGSLGQLSDGQNRFGPNQSGATYCIDDGKITDKNGRGCILTGPTTQFQCDQGASPTGGFSVASSGQFEHDGDATFYACPVDDNGNYNIYTKPLENMPKCVKVGLSSADGTCAAPSSAPASSAPPVTTAVSVSVSTAAPSVSVSVSTEQCQPSTVVKTVTEQNNVTVPVTEYKTQYQTQTLEHTDTAYQTETKQIPTTIYQTQTQYSTINETQTVSTTVYKTHEETTTVYKTEEITSTAVRTEEQYSEDHYRAAYYRPISCHGDRVCSAASRHSIGHRAGHYLGHQAYYCLAGPCHRDPGFFHPAAFRRSFRHWKLPP